MSAWDEGQTYYQDQQLPVDGTNAQETPVVIRGKFREFIRNFREEEVFIYRDQLRNNMNREHNALEVALEDVALFDASLGQLLLQRPLETIPIFEQAALDTAMYLAVNPSELEHVHDIQVMLTSREMKMGMRELDSAYVSKLVQIPGIVIAATKPRAKATHVYIMCRNCHNTKMLDVKLGFSGVQLPRKCDRVLGANETKCPIDPYVILGEKSKYVDQQSLKLQERPESVPTSEMPRSVLLAADRHLVNTLVPGERVSVLGVYSIFSAGGGRSKDSSSVAIRMPYLRVIGIQKDSGPGEGRGAPTFTAEEEEEFIALARETDIYGKIARSIAPSIYGNDDMKRAIACQLMGGARKRLPDGMRLRGDINVLFLGDPSTAKSQLLKFAEKVAPIAVYTSGKGSSAAGLTASVIRDAGSREFYLEGGAMVLADGGIVCIDEFDKMKEADRVAIHEAMEQQTISIAKAGITTILNSRTAVLAAANPVFGRYRDEKSAAENIDFQSSILSRFDLIFIVRDVHDESRDKSMAGHVLNVHMQSNLPDVTTEERGEISLDILKRYIAYCRSHCSPRLSPAAAELLKSMYVNIRNRVRQQDVAAAAHGAGSAQPIPITVRQLEAIIRLSESLARMSLLPEATEEHVREAYRLFQVSTLQAASSGELSGEGFTSAKETHDIMQAEALIRRRMSTGSRMSVENLVRDVADRGGIEGSIHAAIRIMAQRDELEFTNQRRMVYRKR